MCKENCSDCRQFEFATTKFSIRSEVKKNKKMLPRKKYSGMKKVSNDTHISSRKFKEISKKYNNHKEKTLKKQNKITRRV